MVLLTSGGYEDIWRRHRRDLESRISGRIADSAIETSSYSTNAGNFEIAPVAVVIPEGIEDVVEVVRFCARYGMPVTARGAGSSVTDAALGNGIVIDFSRSMNSIMALDTESGLVTVGAGITLEALNEELKKYDKMFPLFPVKGRSCTVGGCIATDAGGYLTTGYGRMHDLVLSISAVDATGRLVEFRREDGGFSHPELEGLKAKVAPVLLSDNWPRYASCGYRLASFGGEHVDYVDLMTGSEGSLSLFVSATLKIVDVMPEARSSVISFQTAGEAFEYAAARGGDLLCAEFMDSRLFAAFQAVHRGLKLPEGTNCHLLLIRKEEASEESGTPHRGGHDTQQLQSGPDDILTELTDALHGLQRPTSSGRYVVAAEGLEMPTERLPDLMLAVEAISRRYALSCLVFGHAAQGVMYVRPQLNLRRQDDRHKLASFLTELATAVRAEGGRLSSENGLGMQLSPYAKYAVSEDRLRACNMVKRAMDPQMILGVPLGAGGDAEAHYRFGPEHERKPFKPMLNWYTPDIVSRFDKQPLSMLEEIDACHGCGECRTLSYIETQCPVYKTTGSELTSPRGLNNLIRLLNNLGGVPTIALYSREYERSIYDCCIECKMCVAECPSHVNTPKIMIEARSQHVKRMGPGSIGRASRFFADYELYTMVASSIARLSNRLIRSRNARSALEHVMGIDRRRKIPEFDLEPFGEWFEKHIARPGRRGEVAYFADMYANYFDSRIGRAVVGMLGLSGYATLFPKQRFTGLPLIYLGMLREAKKYILENVSYLYPFAARGMPVVCSSPSAVMALRVDYPGVVDDERSRAAARTVVDIHEFLCKAMRTGNSDLSFSPVAGRILYHPSCHSRALGTDKMVLELLGRIPGAEVVELQAGCCGAGGSYGFAKETFNLSMEIGRRVFREVGGSESGNTVLVTDGEECALQIEQATGRAPEMTLLLLARAAGITLERAKVRLRG